MARLGQIVKNEERKRLVAKYAARREALRGIIRNPHTPPERRADAYDKLRALPRDASPVRVRNRCAMTGRSRAYLGDFGLSRIAFRELALRGDIPGVIKSSW
jgi:small subunit ribosomal protein S14